MQETPLSKAAVLVVDKYSLPAHIGLCTAGVKYPVIYEKEEGIIYYTRGFFSILADLAYVSKGTSIFFYKRRIDESPTNRGFLGEWYALGEPYEAKEELSYRESFILGSCPRCHSPLSEIRDSGIYCKSCLKVLYGHILPLRFPIQEARIYRCYLDDNTAYVDITDAGRLSTLIFRKIYGAGRERSVNPILPEESEKIRRLLKRKEKELQDEPPDFCSIESSFLQPSEFQPISLYLDFSKQYSLQGRGLSYLYDEDGMLVYESILEFWMMYQLSHRPKVVAAALNIDDEIEWFGNQVLFGIGGEKSDLLILTRDKEYRRNKAIVVELKRDVIDNRALTQSKSYAYWIAQLATAQLRPKCAEPFEIVPVVIGKRKGKGLSRPEEVSFEIPYHRPLCIKVKSPQIYLYEIDPRANTLRLRPM